MNIKLKIDYYRVLICFGVNNYPTICNNMQYIYVCKPLYIFRVVSPPIIRSSYICIYSN